MQIVIDIPEEEYMTMQRIMDIGCGNSAMKRIVEGVPLTHCKDCGWWNESYRECESPNWDTQTDRYITAPAGGYCMWAERRTE